MNKIADIERHLVDAVVREIDEMVSEDHVTDAIEKLLDMIRDFIPDQAMRSALRTSAVKLAARNSRFNKARRNNFPEPESV